jgi:hypothetical protein
LEEKMKIPNFDDVDLGIIAILLIAIGVVIVVAILIFNTLDPAAAISILGLCVTAISTLAGRKLKPDATELSPADLDGGPPNNLEPVVDHESNRLQEAYTKKAMEVEQLRKQLSAFEQQSPGGAGATAGE